MLEKTLNEGGKIMESKGTSCSVHHCHHGSHNACISLVPIFNLLEVDQMNEVMGAIQSITYQKGGNYL